MYVIIVIIAALVSGQPIVAKTHTLADIVLPVGCGMCVLDMKSEYDCRLAVRIEDKNYIVSGSDIDDHGDAHGPTGMCNMVRRARVTGTIKNGKFVASRFKLLSLDRVDKKGNRSMKSADKTTNRSPSGFDIARLSRERIQELAEKLTPEERSILLDKGTERPFCGGLLDNKEHGSYACRLCGLPLFASDAKFTSGTGWPSFFQPFDDTHIHEERDSSHGMVRVEIQCVRCRSHLGHVFPDGPPPTGQRYCLNSAALIFKQGEMDKDTHMTEAKQETAYFAGGCFWGVEDRLQQVPGVIDAASGYMGGQTKDPTYKAVCAGTTGHAETVRVIFDPTQVTYRALLEKFFQFHDPTQLNRQGPDRGSQYRSAIFASNDEQLRIANSYIEEMREAGRFGGQRIVTQVEMGDVFYEAEEYHQDYHAKHGGSCALP